MAELLPELVETRDHLPLKSFQLLLLKTFTVSAKIPGECPLPFTGVRGDNCGYYSFLTQQHWAHLPSFIKTYGVSATELTYQIWKKILLTPPTHSCQLNEFL